VIGLREADEEVAVQVMPVVRVPGECWKPLAIPLHVVVTARANHPEMRPYALEPLNATVNPPAGLAYAFSRSAVVCTRVLIREDEGADGQGA